MSIHIDARETIELLKSLVAINSVNPSLIPDGPGEGEIAERIAVFMREAGLEVRVDEVAPGRFNVVGRLRSAHPQPGRTLMLNGHTDTVGAGNMDIGPFDPVEKEGRVYGRGAADMKAGVTAMLAAAAAVARSGGRLQGDLIVAAVADEEYASIGTEALVKTHTADAAIVTEPTGLNIVVAHKGFAWIKYVTEGRAAHGSRPDEGIDAIMLMTEVLSELNALEQTALAGRTHPLLGRPSLHASLIRGGKELSTYPDCCELDVERRLIPGENRETVVREISEVMDRCRVRHPLFKGRAEMYFYRDALEIDRDAAIVRVLHQTAERRLGRSPHYSAMTGWMDSGILTPAGIPTVVFGPGGEGFHAAVEYAYTDQLVQCADILAQTAAAFCGVEE